VKRIHPHQPSADLVLAAIGRSRVATVFTDGSDLPASYLGYSTVVRLRGEPVAPHPFV
jgi:hypothetical protein